MKKYLTVSIALILCVVGWIFIRSYFFVDFYLGGEEIKTGPFVAEGREIYRNIDGKKERFEVRGVNLSTFLPGRFVTDFAVSKSEYLEWFRLIQEMGANTVRIPTIYNSGFYDALYEYNTKREEAGEEPLYLLQALWVTDGAQDSWTDARSDDFYGQLEIDIQNVVDLIYGNTLLPYAKTRGNGWYRSDVSDWVVGITLGTTWRGETTAYTNQMQQKPRYEGEWFCASEEASQFETMLAELLDTLVDYESKKYGRQHMVSVASEPVTDPFSYEKLIEVQIGKYDRIDAEHIVARETVLGGFFVSYKLYPFCPDILDYLTRREKVRLFRILTDIPRAGSYGGYLELLNRYHSIPVVVGECGYSSARGITQAGDGTASCGLTEKEQGEALTALYGECRDAGISGVLFSAWQDNWAQTDWNIYPMTDKGREPVWHNVQSEAQGYGLMAFEPGEEPVVCVDGDPSEWEGEKPLLSGEWGGLYVRQDAAYLYLYLDRSGATRRSDRIYIPIDVTGKSGGRRCAGENVSFARAADFLLYLDGKRETGNLRAGVCGSLYSADPDGKQEVGNLWAGACGSLYSADRDGKKRDGEEEGYLLVQEYYDPWRAAWNQRIEHIDAYTIDVPEKDSEEFVPLRMVLDSPPEALADWNLRNAATADTGKLRFGTADPQDPSYDSQADFYTAGDHTEIRIPWALLNFQDPSQGTVHDDYYQHYGIEGQTVREIYLGLGGRSAQEITMAAYSLTGWGRKAAFHQRLKQSYRIVQECWGNESTVSQARAQSGMATGKVRKKVGR